MGELTGFVRLNADGIPEYIPTLEMEDAVLRYTEGQSFANVARTLNVEPGTFWHWLPAYVVRKPGVYGVWLLRPEEEVRQERETIIRRIGEGASPAEIADEMGLPHDNVRCALRAAGYDSIIRGGGQHSWLKVEEILEQGRLPLYYGKKHKRSDREYKPSKAVPAQAPADVGSTVQGDYLSTLPGGEDGEPDVMMRKIERALYQAAEQRNLDADTIKDLKQQVLDNHALITKLQAKLEAAQKIAADNLHDAENWRQHKRAEDARKRHLSQTILGPALDALTASLGRKD